MKRFFIIFLTFILMLCSFNFVFAEKQIDPVSGIREQLDNIEMNINKNNPDEAKNCLSKLREYVYDWALELTKQNLYTSRVLEIVDLSALAIEKNDIEYVKKARSLLDELVFYKQPPVLLSNHS